MKKQTSPKRSPLTDALLSNQSQEAGDSAKEVEVEQFTRHPQEDSVQEEERQQGSDAENSQVNGNIFISKKVITNSFLFVF